MLVDMNLSPVGWSSPLAIYCSSPHKFAWSGLSKDRGTLQRLFVAAQANRCHFLKA
jgi:hypothetical protein